MKARVTERYGEKEVIAYRTEQPDDVASLAIQLIERWGLVAAVPDGEDSAGRAKCRLPTPAELVVRAFDIAEQAVKLAHDSGHMIALPDLNEVNAAFDAKRAAARARAPMVEAMAEASE